MSVYSKLNQAREQFHSLELKKTGRNTFANYNYFELGDFLIPALKVFREVGLCAYVSFDKEIATMTIVDMESNDKMEITSPMGSAALKGCHEVQNIGAVETYQRRYLWVAALEIVEHDALDATTGREEPAKTTQRKPNGLLPGIGVHKGTDGMLEALPEEMQLHIRLLASVLPKMFADQGIEAAFDKIESQQFENDEKVALWGLLDSKLRSALKREGEKRHTKEPAKETA
jgi:hypothetical protein